MESYWWNLLGQVDILGYSLLTLERAFLIYVLHLLAQIHSLADQFDQAILDGNVDIGAFLNLLGEITLGFDRERFATAVKR